MISCLFAFMEITTNILGIAILGMFGWLIFETIRVSNPEAPL